MSRGMSAFGHHVISRQCSGRFWSEADFNSGRSQNAGRRLGWLAHPYARLNISRSSCSRSGSAGPILTRGMALRLRGVWTVA
jgi:hypothetical protein